jgi:hypothetical protein
MRLIDADALIEAIDAMLKENIRQGAKVSGCTQSSRNLFHYGCGLTTAKEMLLSASTIDAVPVVRCKDCKNFSPRNLVNFCARTGRTCEPNDYCSYGERREAER